MASGAWVAGIWLAGIGVAGAAGPPRLAAQDSVHAEGPAAVSRIPGVENSFDPAARAALRQAGDDAQAADSGGRPRAFFYSPAYGVRLKIHLIASYAELPLFAAEYVVGQRLLNQERTSFERPRGLRSAHKMLASGLGVLFAVNTVTGVWNLWDARHDPNGRFERTLHGLTMLAADAGFLWAASTARGARRTDAGAVRHRNIAIGSMSLATASTVMMWIWKH
jgi:hypothetical protein